MSRRRISIVVLSCIVVALVAACGSDRSQSRPLVAYVAPTLANPFFVKMKEGADAAAATAGVELAFQAPPGGVEDAAAQNDLVEAMLARKPLALCIVPANSKAILPAIALANKAGVPVINIDNRIDSVAAVAAGVSIAAYIGSDNRLGGQLAGEMIVNVLKGKGRVAVLEGLVGSDAAIQRAAGFRTAISSAPGITVVATETASWSRDQGFDKFLAMLQAHPDLDAVFAANDEMALGAIRALRERGSKRQRSHIIVVGFDASPDGLTAVNQGEMLATVAQQPSEMGKSCVEAAMKLKRKESVASQFAVPVVLVKKDSSKTVP